ncbi:unnamed protein product [marine sediment metagenome]|uniref:Uncharacterized protein n=1 Tax=marine sediment metagenome TaxID=412755 RepID=X1DMX8_9ZZZZ
MAKVEIREYREQYAHFGFYKQGAGGDVILLIRRKVGDPTDYMHDHSKAVQRQREIFTQASQHYAHLTPTQKADWRRQIRWVSRIKPGSKSEEVILKGRQLFISEDIHELATKQKQLVLPLEICIMLVDDALNPLEGELWLYCTVTGEWFDLPKEEIAKGCWLFTKVPPGYPPYRVYGEALEYLDPLLPEHQAMSEDEMKAYHYHVLLPGVPPYHLPYTRYNYSSWAWYISHRFKPTELIKWVYVYTKITTRGFDGTLTTGIKEPFYPPPPPEWITSKERTVSLAYGETAYYFTILPATALVPNTNYYLVLLMADEAQPTWWGYNDVWLIP